MSAEEHPTVCRLEGMAPKNRCGQECKHEVFVLLCTLRSSTVFTCMHVQCCETTCLQGSVRFLTGAAGLSGGGGGMLDVKNGETINLID